MWNTLNRIGNTVSIPGRLLKTWLTASADIFDTLAAIPKDMKNVISYTSDEIKNIFTSAYKKGKRYQRIGNTLLSPFVALWTAVEWAVRSVVTPMTNFVANTIKTWKNVVNNTFKSTLGSLFSKKTVSNFKYDELKTSNVIEKNKNWFSKWRLSRKVFQDNENKVNNTKQLKTSQTREKNQKIDTNDTKKTDQTEKINESEENNEKGNDNKKAKSSENKEININWNKSEDEKDTKNLKNNKNVTQDDSDNWISKKNKENSEETTETVQQNSEHIWVNEAKAILNDSPCGKIIIDNLCERYNDFWIIFDNTSPDGSWNADHTITVWTKMPAGISGLAPFNWNARDKEVQKKHILLHELSHCVLPNRRIPWVQEWLKLIKKYIEDRENINWRTLSILSYSNNRNYDTPQKKAKEDFVEMLALRMNWDWHLCKKYLKLLSEDEYRSFRENHWLVTITKEDASKLQSIFDGIINYYGY